MEKKSKVESKVSFDERKKELTHHTIETTETEVGSLVITSEGKFHEEGIKNIVRELNKRIGDLNHAISTQEKIIKKCPDMTPELQALKDQLIILQEIDKADKQRIQLEDNQANLKKTKKDLRDIKEEIGTRLKL